MPTITIRVPEALKAEIETAAAERDLTVSEYTRHALGLVEDTEDVIGGLLSDVEQLWGRVRELEQKVGSPS